MGQDLTRTAGCIHIKAFRILLVVHSLEREGAPIELLTSYVLATANRRPSIGCVRLQVRMAKLHGIYGDGWCIVKFFVSSRGSPKSIKELVILPGSSPNGVSPTPYPGLTTHTSNQDTSVVFQFISSPSLSPSPIPSTPSSAPGINGPRLWAMLGISFLLPVVVAVSASQRILLLGISLAFSADRKPLIEWLHRCLVFGELGKPPDDLRRVDIDEAAKGTKRILQHLGAPVHGAAS